MGRTTLKNVLVAGLTSLAFTGNAMADFECNVKILQVLLYADGWVSVRHSGRNDYTHICNLNSNVANVTPITCAVWAASVQAMKSKNTTVNFWYTGSGSCATMPTYQSSPIPLYIGATDLP